MATKDIKPRVRVPKKLKKGDVFLVKTLVTHRMESGQRPNKDKPSEKHPREIINKFSAVYNDVEVIRADWHPGVSANPYTSFFAVADKSGPMVLTWTDDNGATFTKTVKINVTG